jgi:GNAT superfamily N-acetyltransferase
VLLLWCTKYSIAVPRSHGRAVYAIIAPVPWPYRRCASRPHRHATSPICRGWAPLFVKRILRIVRCSRPTPRKAFASFSDHFPWFPADWAWVLIGYVDDHPAGMAVLTRMPKMDRRLGFLYLDELHVLAPSRRQGLATALLQKSASPARSLGLAGIRLCGQDRERDRSEALGGCGVPCNGDASL